MAKHAKQSNHAKILLKFLSLISRIAVLRNILLQCIEAFIFTILLLNLDDKDFIGNVGD